MSRCYEIGITVTEHQPDKFDAIVAAVQALDYEAEAELVGRGIIFQHEAINVRAAFDSEQQIAAEIQQAIWVANGTFCHVDVNLRDLDSGTESYGGSLADWYKFAEKQNSI